jgi:hypothetical protein
MAEKNQPDQKGQRNTPQGQRPPQAEGSKKEQEQQRTRAQGEQNQPRGQGRER